MRFVLSYSWLMILCAAISFASAPAYAGRGLTNFTGSEPESTNLKPFPKWTGALSRYFNERKLASQPCGSQRFNPCALKNWQAHIDSLRGASREEQVRGINKYLNGIKYIEDPVNWGVSDYWATPNEFFEVDGDCEDYAISKFMSLRALGVSNDDMRIMIVQDMNLGGILHGILAVRLNGETWILDNQIPSAVKASSIYHYRPIYSINETSWWRH